LLLLLILVAIVDCEKSGMADMVFEMIQDADIDTRAEYYKHIVLSGKGLS
jgi:actin-related protein 2